ncbi:hypothetical protein FXO38_12348, partial [Capsicum annuum]
EKDLGRKPTQVVVFKRTHLKKKTNELDSDVWVDPKAENSNVEVIDDVQLAAMLQQITDFSHAFSHSVAQNEVMSKIVEEIKEQVVSMSHRHGSPSPDSSCKEEIESDEFVDTTP